MENYADLNIKVDPGNKKRAEEILSGLGIPMSTAIDMYLAQISLTGGIPFNVSIPKAPKELNMDLMNRKQLEEALKKGIDEAEAGKVREASAAFREFRESL